ncbi:MAG: hypothetical protein QOG80_2993, partial [Pseudonocardiales bacterium]|nr:hypothetical protein [Pseudonocardiales bacterium]
MCLPAPAVAAALGDAVTGVDVVFWDAASEPPLDFAQAEFWVPPYVSRVPAREDVARGQALQVVQLLSAGVEPWLDRIPPGVTLCSGRGIHSGSTAELAVAGLLSLWRDLPHFLDAQRAHRW